MYWRLTLSYIDATEVKGKSAFETSSTIIINKKRSFKLIETLPFLTLHTLSQNIVGLAIAQNAGDIDSSFKGYQIGVPLPCFYFLEWFARIGLDFSFRYRGEYIVIKPRSCSNLDVSLR